MQKFLFGSALILALMIMTVSPALAAVDVTVQGTVDSIDTLAGTFSLTTEEAITYTVTPPEGFDLTTLAIGDQVEVMGDTDELGGLFATSITELTESVVTGVIQSINAETCSFDLLTPEGTTLTVLLPEGSDCSSFLVGDAVEVSGTLNDDGTFSASNVVVLPPDEDEDGDGEKGVNTGFYCANPEVPHPALNRVALAYGADYAVALDWFCDGGLGIGGIKMAHRLGLLSGKTAQEILELRASMGWGQVKKALNSASETPEEPAEVSNQGNGNSAGNGNANGGNNTGGNGNGNGNDGDHGGGPPPWAGGGNGQGNGQGHGQGKNK
ncbi:MAG: DUF5666 domain-containing protein [Anaerolineales bacterium]